MSNMKMLYYDRIGASEGIIFNKTSESKYWKIFYYWCFLKRDLSFNQISAMDAMIH